MVKKEKCHKKVYFITGWTFTTRYKSSQAWQNIRIQNVRYCCKDEKAVSPDQTYHGVQIRLALVGPIHYILEWNQFSVLLSRNFC